MRKLVEILEGFIETLDVDDYFAANELGEYAAESEAEQAVVDALKKYERVFDDGAIGGDTKTSKQVIFCIVKPCDSSCRKA